MVDTVLTSSHKKILNVVYVLNLTKSVWTLMLDDMKWVSVYRYRNSALLLIPKYAYGTT